MLEGMMSGIKESRPLDVKNTSEPGPIGSKEVV